MNKDEDLTESTRVKLNFRIPPRMPSLYAYHLIVQAGEEEVTLSFFEIVPPLVISETEEQMERLREQGISADCIARITIAKNRFPSFVEAMQQTLNLMKAEQPEEGQADADNSSNN